MKAAFVLATIPFTQALVGLGWSVLNSPSSGLKDITFPISMANAPHQTGFYLADFVAGTTSTDPNYIDDADGGAGISCSVDIPAPYAPLYHLVVKNTGGTTWTGTLVDTVSGKSTHVGSYTLPNGAGGIKSGQVGFIEYYLWNDMANHMCSSLPYTDVTFGAPTTSTPGAGSGQLIKPYEYGDCVGKVNFDVQETAQGYQVTGVSWLSERE
ncbi:hypothetical protein CNMCM5793_007386 [Aspergillus hiratsukae]|uniref:Uncharacterized protein n=1 Tax=Aspergillus hiratsukae TaxID=1194566 RepID=A0A8H6P5I9_9EURO|nr:hypothetical protein CNMCM5793_007386 [Aspergillus hiratsukae]KAF7172225.1 hypothetical protein CNMCM6106_006484 [Aspergillus hiratsukae]